MNYDPGHEPRGATPDPALLWGALLASTAAPKHAMSALELDGYLTGVIVAPGPIRPSRWMAGLWENDEPVLGNVTQVQSALDAVALMFNTLSTRIERSLQRLEAERICDYRPAFQPIEGKPPHEAVRTWAGGFWKAMALTPAEWSALAEDERLQPIIAPLVGFIELDDPEFEPAEDIDDRLDQAAANIPRAILLLRKIAQLRESRASLAGPTHRTKIGRNDPCPCRSGKKYKRCCGLS
ncbi:MAG TPA: UPF0149 family protein [Stellaceae bacterium]|nr:UPF0149 family protein [Stellaceae bacterium]